MKKIITFGLILFLLIPIFIKAEKTDSEWDVLEEILYDLEGEPSEGDIVFNGVILDSFIKQDEINRLGEKIVENLELVGEEIDPFILQDKTIGEYYSKMVIFEEDYSQINYDGYDYNGNQIFINLNSYINEEINLEETSLSISIVKDDDFFEINDIMEKIETIYEDFNCEWDLTSCLIGKVKGKYPNEEFSDKFEIVLKHIKGNIVEEFSDEDFSSYTVYSPLIENYLIINKKKININLSIRYNEEEDYTYLWIGTPIITAGY